ncbi:LPXTG cell wall anchor domain-containing protein [Enterococcus hulanensis]|uniref:LPXTG cell wall anchor domain-containing protein n=1 Tax=Enterococcus hulanensis TaxID=2559929 RepID=UPI0011329DCD|nr:LPXTG cell wall anchor domain-containing protein [Enterococcus hulanensis]MDT2659183.1 LPXTG cell wall anchor domain-containing protein [Enterococcus hulanensis]
MESTKNDDDELKGGLGGAGNQNTPTGGGSNTRTFIAGNYTENGSTKKSLPKTGSVINHGYIWIGIIFIFSSLVLLGREKKIRNNEK